MKRRCVTLTDQQWEEVEVFRRDVPFGERRMSVDYALGKLVGDSLRRRRDSNARATESVSRQAAKK